MRICFWPADRSGCGYYRCALPAQQLRKLGHDVVVGQLLDPGARDGEFDVVVGQRIAEPGPSRIWRELCYDSHVMTVFELDDDFWSIDPSNQVAYRYYDEATQQRLKANIADADLVTVTTDTLADVVSQWNSNVAVLPNCIPAKLLDRPMPGEDEPVTIGYGASPSHTRDFGEIAKPLKRVIQRFRDRVEFHSIGHDFTGRVATTRARTRHTGWLASVEEYYSALDFQIGLAPLRDIPFNRSKSDIKLLEYSALGIPALASFVRPYVDAVNDDCPALGTSFGGRDWEIMLADLITNPGFRAELGIEARRWAATRTIEANAALWEKAYSS